MKTWDELKYNDEYKINEKVSISRKKIKKGISNTFDNISKPEMIDDITKSVIEVLNKYGYSVD